MKHFRDIQVLQVTGVDAEPNDGAFAPGDRIQVTEKIDGANASTMWNLTERRLEVYSRKEALHSGNTLRGFYGYALGLDTEKISSFANFVIFGEWLVPHAVGYDKDAYMKWYVYDIWDTMQQCWMPQDFVKMVCDICGLNYIHVLYEGPFISWDHIKELAKGKSAYGANTMEGCVVKNLSKLNDSTIRAPKYLKYINESFAENKKHPFREIDPEKEAAKASAHEMMATVCTMERVRKEIFKCIDEGLLTLPLGPQNLNAIAKLVPKRVYLDLVKDENAIVQACGEYAGKMSGSMTMQHVKKLLDTDTFKEG
jgi:hypothetical protein